MQSGVLAVFPAQRLQRDHDLPAVSPHFWPERKEGVLELELTARKIVDRSPRWIEFRYEVLASYAKPSVARKFACVIFHDILGTKRVKTVSRYAYI